MNLNKKYDLVFSHTVVDHVYDIDAFLSKLVAACGKYAYINSYRGFFSGLKKHKIEWKEEDKCFYNNLSLDQIRQTLIDAGLQDEEFVIQTQESGQNGDCKSVSSYLNKKELLEQGISLH